MSFNPPAITAEQLTHTAGPLAGPLNAATWEERPLYGGAIEVAIPKRFNDCSHYQTELGVCNEALSNDFLQSGTITQDQMPFFGGDVPKFYCISSQRISKFKDSPDKANIVQIYMAVIRLKRVTTDLLISFNVPMVFGHGSSSEGRAIVNSEENMAVIEGVLKTLQIKDWGLFGEEATLDQTMEDNTTTQ